MPCRRPEKQAFSTRDDALDAMKNLVWMNHVRGEDDRSAGLNVYPCDGCDAWHVGHLPQTPSVYHYDVLEALDDIDAADALVPPEPIRVPKFMRRQLTGGALASFLELEELTAMTWFTWNGAWDFARAPHPGIFWAYRPEERIGEGFIRLVVPAFAAQLRWPDYVERNKVTKHRRARAAANFNPAEWLATDAAVPRDTFRSIDVWHRGAWVPITDVDPDDFERGLAESSKTP